MRAVWYERTGPAREVLQVGEIERPTPAAGEVLVRMAWSGVNPSDVKRRAGWNQQSMAFQRVVPGNDGAGIIEDVGSGVDAGRIGQRVWLHSTGWKRPLGTAAQWTVTASDRAAPLPPNVSLRMGAALGVPALTAHRALFGLGSVLGRSVMVTGGAGAVGGLAIQLARWAGARVIATVSSDAKAELALAAGAETCINYRTEDVASRVLALTGGNGVDHLVEVDFGANLPIALKVLRDNGTIATYASMTQPLPTLPFYALMLKNLRLMWVFVYELEPGAIRQGQEDINHWLATDRFVPPAFHEFDLADAAVAHEAVEGGVPGKVLIAMDRTLH